MGVEKNCHWGDLETYHIFCNTPCGTLLPVQFNSSNIPWIYIFLKYTDSTKLDIDPGVQKSYLFITETEVLLQNYSLAFGSLTPTW